MTPLEQRLTKLAEKLGDDYSAKMYPVQNVQTTKEFTQDVNFARRMTTNHTYKQGAAAMIPIIVKLAEALKFECSNKRSDLNPCNATETLKELEDFINKQGE